MWEEVKQLMCVEKECERESKYIGIIAENRWINIKTLSPSISFLLKIIHFSIAGTNSNLLTPLNDYP